MRINALISWMVVLWFLVFCTSQYFLSLRTEKANDAIIRRYDPPRKPFTPRTRTSVHIPVKLDQNDQIEHVLYETLPDTLTFTEKHLLVRYARNVHEWKSAEVAQVVSTLLEILTDFLEFHHIQYWLDRGTLLGSYREEDFIPWDWDADIGMVVDDVAKFKNALKKWKFPQSDIVVIFRDYSPVIPFKVANTSNGRYVDGLVYRQEKETVYTQWPYECPACEKNGEVSFPASLLFPLANCSFARKTYPCPSNMRDYLYLWYDSLRAVR